MNILVSYGSKYGTTKRYARWIAEELACDLADSREVSVEKLKSYDVIIHGGGLYAGGLCGIHTIVKNFDAIADKQIILFSCGLADPEDPENVAHIEAGLEKVLTPEMRGKIKQFHLRGGIDYSRLGLKHKAMMAMLRSVMLKKGYNNLRGEDQMMLDTYSGTVDFTSRESLAPPAQLCSLPSITEHGAPIGAPCLYNNSPMDTYVQPNRPTWAVMPR